MIKSLIYTLLLITICDCKDIFYQKLISLESQFLSLKSQNINEYSCFVTPETDVEVFKTEFSSMRPNQKKLDSILDSYRIDLDFKFGKFSANTPVIRGLKNKLDIDSLNLFFNLTKEMLLATMNHFYPMFAGDLDTTILQDKRNKLFKSKDTLISRIYIDSNIFIDKFFNNNMEAHRSIYRVSEDTKDLIEFRKSHFRKLKNLNALVFFETKTNENNIVRFEISYGKIGEKYLPDKIKIQAGVQSNPRELRYKFNEYEIK